MLDLSASSGAPDFGAAPPPLPAAAEGVRPPDARAWDGPGGSSAPRPRARLTFACLPAWARGVDVEGQEERW